MFSINKASFSMIAILAVAMMLFVVTDGEAFVQDKPGASVIWRDPGAVEKLDFVGGPGGRENAPKPPFAFIEENLSGTNPKIRVSDAGGVKWNVKFGSEVNAETFATRIAWAVGYFVEPSYFVANGKVDDLGELKRAKNHVKADGSFVNARFERTRAKDIKSLEDKESWSWIKNPFFGSKELNGLKVIMMLVSNWDNKDLRDFKRGSNTKIFQYPNGREDYLVSDWGGSMGKWGGYITRGKWSCEGYTQQTPDFVKGVMGDNFVWGYTGQHTKDFNGDIRIGDVRWLMQYLGKITDDQLRAGLEASGASPDEVACFARAVRERINQIRNCIE